MAEPMRILIVEDLPTDAELAQREISKTLDSCTFMCVDTREAYLTALGDFQPDIIISDYRMPRFDGLTALKLALKIVPDTPVIILTSAMNEDTAVECMKTGATDYVIKEHVKRLGQAVIHALEKKREKAERRRAEEEKARLEMQLLQAQRIESLGRLAGGVAHDFNNMLTVILGRVELIKTTLPPSHALLNDLQEIEKAAIHSRDITRQLLAFSRKQLIEPRVIDLNELITNTQKTVARLIGEDINLRVLLGNDLWKIKFDASQVDQILVNLVVNARDAMPHGGNVTIETSNLSIDTSFCRENPLFVPGQYVLLQVTDEGAGMDDEVLSHIFEPFFTTKEVGKGTGLGLATVYGIVKQNNGVVTVTSQPGAGTIFKIFIPRCEKADEDASRRVEVTTPPSQGMTVLLVEDNEMVRNVAKRMLEAIGYKVLVAETPDAALSLFEKGKNRIDLLFTDVVMPGMSGKELMDKIRAFTPELKVLFMSGYTSDAIVHRGVFDEGAHFIQKPFDAIELARKICEVMGEK